MAHNIYEIDVLAPPGPTIYLTDEGDDGIDELRYVGVYSQRTSINLQWSWGDTPAAAGTWYPNPSPDANGGRLVVYGRIENARGSNGGDDIIGNPLDNVLYGDNSRDGPGGDDTLAGGEGDDTLYGGRGSDSLQGADGNDRLFGDGGQDSLNGNGGVDVLQGGAGADILAGGGDLGDTVSYSESSAGVSIKLLYGEATIGSGGDAQGDSISGFTDVIGSAFADTIRDLDSGAHAFGYSDNEFSGGDGADILYLGVGKDIGRGGKGGDRLFGEDGNDTLFGDEGNDFLKGGAGNDTLRGGLGADTLTGGDGKDRFLFRSTDESNRSTTDTIADLTDKDIIDLGGIDANANLGGDQAFFLAAALTGTAGQLVLTWNATAGYTDIRGDVNGDGVADFRLIVMGDHADFDNFVF